MSWLEVKSKRRLNRLGFLIRSDKTEESFRFSYVGESGLGAPDIIAGVETQQQTMTIDTASKLDFDLSSLLKIDGALYSVSSIQELENSDFNGPFRGKGCVIKRITASKTV